MPNQGGPARDAGSISFLPWLSYYRPDLTVAGVQVVQGTAASDSFATFVADRPTLVRAFVGVNDGSTVPGVRGRLWIYNELGVAVGSIDSDAISAPSIENNLLRTLNFRLPLDWTKPGYSYYVLVDPNNTIPEVNENNNRYPNSGNMAFNFTYVRPVQVVIVPILYLPFGAAISTLPAGADTRDLNYLEWMPEKVLPVSTISYRLHAPMEFRATGPGENLDAPSGDGWMSLLNEVSNLHYSEDASGTMMYYGLVNSYDAHGCDEATGGCFTGMGWIGGQPGILPTAVGWSGMPNGSMSASKTLAHEMGHNFGREHIFCNGNEGLSDPNYPYNSHSIGVWGVDVGTGTLYNPETYADFMSYCDPVWVSDYTFWSIKTFREQHVYDARADAAPVQALYISGTIAPGGQVTFRPVSEQSAPVSAPPTGPYTLELIGQNGQVVASVPFATTRIADSKGYSGFGFFVPAVSGLAGMRVRLDGQIIGEKSAGR